MTTDSNGKELKDGDDVIVTQDLDIRGSSISIKRGDVIKKIKIFENDPGNIECKIGKATMVIKTMYLKIKPSKKKKK
jgi:protein PhnA